MLVQVFRQRLQPGPDRHQPVWQRGVVAGEEEEDRVANTVECGGPALPDPEHLGVEDRSADVVNLEIALE